MTFLDDLEKIKKIDAKNMAKNIKEFPKQCDKAWQIAKNMEIPADYRKADKVILCGMGASAIGGETVSAVSKKEMKIPVFTVRGYELPAWTDEKTLVVCTSFSGNTEETLECFKGAVKKKSKVMAIAGGGQLKELAGKKKVPIFEFKYDSQPRTAMGYLSTSVLGILCRIGIIDGKELDMEGMVGFLKEFGESLSPESPTIGNMAKNLAFSMFDRIPVTVGAGILGPVARRWKTQFNENAKNFAFFEEFPAANHNTVEGIKMPSRGKDDFIFLFLRSSLDSSKIRKGFEALAKLMEKEGVDYREIPAFGKDPWTQKFSLTLLGDWASFYLAMLNHTDPTSIKNIDWIKSRQSKDS